jgi:hypothetical protein
VRPSENNTVTTRYTTGNNIDFKLFWDDNQLVIAQLLTRNLKISGITTWNNYRQSIPGHF